jgi:hypothetical protein
MLISALLLIICYFLFKYTAAWILYYNQIDKRMPRSIWRYSYDYSVVGIRDISDLEDKVFVRQRRKRNIIVTMMYFILILAFIIINNFVASILIYILS